MRAYGTSCTLGDAPGVMGDVACDEDAEEDDEVVVEVDEVDVFRQKG